MGLNAENLLIKIPQQVYPPLEPRLPLTPLQQKLMRKLGSRNLYPFCIELPDNFPNSVVFHPTPNNGVDPCGIVHELKAYIGKTLVKVKGRDYVTMEIRKVMYTSSQPCEQPTARVIQRFWFSDPLLLRAKLNKQIYYHGEKIVVDMYITNYSRRYVKKIIVTVKQLVTSRMSLESSFTTVVAKVKSENGFTVSPDEKVSTILEITPLFSNNRHQKRLAVDGQTHNADTNLASSTKLDEKIAREKDVDMTVQYVVEIKLKFSFFRR
ncbi:beta-arrestin-1-like [Cotesia glomerata]|uniref:beta-arrestin-1-like n=1 Tax=Cotesia glomerata TaxID=32391 RepID=UPI001D01DEDB|nr:beta-arrestin-1-like [Cotesia glomerata]